MKNLPSIALGTYPIIGVTKSYQIEEAVQATKINLTPDEISYLEKLAQETGVDTKGAWENHML